MAKWWEYPAWRRTALQVAMWALFGASLGMAALVTSYRQGQVNARYSPPIDCGSYVVRVPANWKVILHPRTGVNAEAVEPVTASNHGKVRHVYFIEKQLTEPADPEEFLAQVQGPAQPNESTEDPNDFPIAGQKGIVMRRAYWRPVAIIAREQMVELAAAVVSPKQDALAIRMICQGDSTPEDAATFKNLLERVELNEK